MLLLIIEVEVIHQILCIIIILGNFISTLLLLIFLIISAQDFHCIQHLKKFETQWKPNRENGSGLNKSIPCCQKRIIRVNKCAQITILHLSKIIFLMHKIAKVKVCCIIIFCQSPKFSLYCNLVL